MSTPKTLEIIIGFDDEALDQYAKIEIAGCTGISMQATPKLEDRVDFDTGESYQVVKAVAYTVLVNFDNGVRL